MFAEVIGKKNSSLIPSYYHHEFVLYANGQVTNYEEFLSSHQQHLSSTKIYQFEYDDETFIEKDGKLAGRIWITVSVPNGTPHKIEVVLIVQYKDGKIFRIWETTFPDWSQLPEFQNQ